MIDYARITVRSGSGGQGAGSFFHLKGKRYGKADGGDGGSGANVLLEATRDLNTLEPFRYIKDYKAKNGENGLSNRRKGADGEDLVVRVPVGTTVNVVAAGESYDLVEVGQRVLVARGGRGGRGNAKLRDEYGRRPKSGEVGETGEEQKLTLELKLIADVGLIGLPNAGKSTLLSKLTAATPKIADYPFTTLEPNLGVMQVKAESQSFDKLRMTLSSSKGQSGKSKNSLYTHDFDSRLILADIPGLIEGASQGKGLGDLFLRHIVRTKVLIHLVDVSNGGQGDRGTKETEHIKGLWESYQTVRNELKAYSKDLAKKREIIVLNKIDQVSPEELESAKAEFINHKKKVFVVSAREGIGLQELVKEVIRVV